MEYYVLFLCDGSGDICWRRRWLAMTLILIFPWRKGIWESGSGSFFSWVSAVGRAGILEGCTSRVYYLLWGFAMRQDGAWCSANKIIKNEREERWMETRFWNSGSLRITLRWKFNMWCCWVFEVAKMDVWVCTESIRESKKETEDKMSHMICNRRCSLRTK